MLSLRHLIPALILFILPYVVKFSTLLYGIENYCLIIDFQLCRCKARFQRQGTVPKLILRDSVKPSKVLHVSGSSPFFLSMTVLPKKKKKKRRVQLKARSKCSLSERDVNLRISENNAR